jgi:PAS domain S-box-containing protein
MASALRVGQKRSKRKRPRVKLPLLNSIDQAVIATDLAGKIVFWNLAAERVYGWKWQEVIGRPIEKLLVPKPAHGDAAKIMEQLRQGKSWTGEIKLRRRDGSEFVATVTDEPMYDGQGNIIGIIGISQPTPRPTEGENLSDLGSAGRRPLNTAASAPLANQPVV